VNIAVRIYTDVAEHTTLLHVLTVVDRARRDVDTTSNSDTLPELVERLARQRLTDQLPIGSSTKFPG
jgi:hypothetical protein